MDLYKYELFCETEQQTVMTDYRETEPTVCPNNTSHTIDTDSITVVDSISDNEVTLSDPTVQLAGFKDLTGHDYWKKSFYYQSSYGSKMEFAEKFDKNLYLSGGGYRVDENAHWGDYAEFSVVDVDNMLGYGAGFTLATFVTTDYCWPDKHWEMFTDDAKLIYQGLYLAFTYVSVAYQEPIESSSSSSSGSFSSSSSSSSSSSTGSFPPVNLAVWYNLRT